MKRVKYLDNVKVFAIFLVCFYHFGWGPNLNDYSTITSLGSFFQKMLSSLSLVGVPLFFMVNGAILLNRKLDLSKHYKVLFKTMGLFWLYMIISIAVISIYKNINIFSGSKGQLVNYILLVSPTEIGLQHLWFMKFLIALYVIFPVIHIFYTKMCESVLLRKYFKRVVIASLLLINMQRISELLGHLIPVFNNLNFYELQALLPINSLFLAVVFYFIIGGLLHRKYYIESTKLDIAKSLMLFFIVLVLINVSWFYSSYFNNNIDVVFSNYTTILGFILSVQSYKIIQFITTSREDHTKIDKAVSLISNHTLDIYYLHWIIGYTILPKLETHLSISTNSTYLFILNVLKSLALVILIPIIVVIINKITILISDLVIKFIRKF